MAALLHFKLAGEPTKQGCGSEPFETPYGVVLEGTLTVLRGADAAPEVLVEQPTAS